MVDAPGVQVEAGVLGRPTTRVILPTALILPVPLGPLGVPTVLEVPSPGTLAALILRSGVTVAVTPPVLLAPTMTSQVPAAPTPDSAGWASVKRVFVKNTSPCATGVVWTTFLGLYFASFRIARRRLFHLELVDMRGLLRDRDHRRPRSRFKLLWQLHR